MSVRLCSLGQLSANGRELDVERRNILIEIRTPFGAGNRNDVLSMPEPTPERVATLEDLDRLAELMPRGAAAGERYPEVMMRSVTG